MVYNRVEEKQYILGLRLGRRGILGLGLGRRGILGMGLERRCILGLWLGRRIYNKVGVVEKWYKIGLGRRDIY